MDVRFECRRIQKVICAGEGIFGDDVRGQATETHRNVHRISCSGVVFDLFTEPSYFSNDDRVKFLYGSFGEEMI